MNKLLFGAWWHFLVSFKRCIHSHLGQSFGYCSFWALCLWFLVTTQKWLPKLLMSSLLHCTRNWYFHVYINLLSALLVSPFTIMNNVWLSVVHDYSSRYEWMRVISKTCAIFKGLSPVQVVSRTTHIWYIPIHQLFHHCNPYSPGLVSTTTVNNGGKIAYKVCLVLCCLMSMTAKSGRIFFSFKAIPF